MSTYGKKCLTSAKQAAAAAQKDDIVIMLCSFGYGVHAPLYQILTGIKEVPDFWKFVTQHITHPKSGDQVLLVSAPSLSIGLDSVKEGFQHILSHVKQKQVRSVGHVWIHDTTRQDLLQSDDKPEDWDNLKRIFEGVIEMRDVMFLSRNWEQEKDANHPAVELVARTHNALEHKVEEGPIFKRLLGSSVSDAWLVIDYWQEVICWTSGEEVWKEDKRVSLIQTDINNLQVELQQTERGQWILNWFKEIWKKEWEYMVETLAKIDKEDNSILKRHMLGAADWEYMMYRKKMWSLFEECGFIKVPVGCYLKHFYGFEVFPEPPKKSIFRHLLKKLEKEEKA